MTSRKETAIVIDAVGKGLCSSVDEMVLVVQTVSYINCELHIGWPWQWEAVTSLVTSQ